MNGMQAARTVIIELFCGFQRAGTRSWRVEIFGVRKSLLSLSSEDDAISVKFNIEYWLYVLITVGP